MFVKVLLFGLLLLIISGFFPRSSRNEDVGEWKKVFPQIRFDNSDGNVILCTYSITSKTGGIPFKYMLKYSPSSCETEIYIKPLALVINLSIYTILSLMIFALVKRSRNN